MFEKSPIGPFIMDKILMWYDQPITFTGADRDGRVWFVQLIEDDGEKRWSEFVLVPLDDSSMHPTERLDEKEPFYDYPYEDMKFLTDLYTNAKEGWVIKESWGDSRIDQEPQVMECRPAVQADFDWCKPTPPNERGQRA